MPNVEEKMVMKALESVILPESQRNIVDAGLLSKISIKDGHIQFSIDVKAQEAKSMEPIRKKAENTVASLPGVLSVTVVLSAHQSAESRAGKNTNPSQEKTLLPEINAIVAVASGKGGVGKSTTAVNLAIAFRQLGLKTAILDADIYGPSLPTMMGITDKPSSPDGKTIIPLAAHGVTCMSIGFLVPIDTAMIWRGPMVMGALEQMMKDVQWGPQDILVIDMPPGTGDAQLTLAQRVPIAGAIIVSTPQDLSLIDARKGIDMFQKVHVPILGIIENMSYFLCPKCGERSEIFSHGGGAHTSKEINVDFLGEIPLDIAIREGGDSGLPTGVSKPDGQYAKAYHTIAQNIWEKVETKASQPKSPKIIFE